MLLFHVQNEKPTSTKDMHFFLPVGLCNLPHDSQLMCRPELELEGMRQIHTHLRLNS